MFQRIAIALFVFVVFFIIVWGACWVSGDEP